MTYTTTPRQSQGRSMKLTRAELDATIRDRDPTRALLDHLERSPAPRIPRLRSISSSRSGPVVTPTRRGWLQRLWAWARDSVARRIPCGEATESDFGDFLAALEQDELQRARARAATRQARRP